MVQQITPVEYVAMIKDEAIPIIDVRSVMEIQQSGTAPKAIGLPMDQINEESLRRFDKHQRIAVLCRSGMRSASVAQFMEQSGFTQVYNVQGGILAWSQAGLPVANL